MLAGPLDRLHSPRADEAGLPTSARCALPARRRGRLADWGGALREVHQDHRPCISLLHGPDVQEVLRARLRPDAGTARPRRRHRAAARGPRLALRRPADHHHRALHELCPRWDAQLPLLRVRPRSHPLRRRRRGRVLRRRQGQPRRALRPAACRPGRGVRGGLPLPPGARLRPPRPGAAQRAGAVGPVPRGGRERRGAAVEAGRPVPPPLRPRPAAKGSGRRRGELDQHQRRGDLDQRQRRG
mmetsp:Transcript_35867/g.92304  ORF Transcript_35867/g.92304 Transcript_35867/m.92304 type:complete len:242 (+) Transcript_35867:268-993(+)